MKLHRLTALLCAAALVLSAGCSKQTADSSSGSDASSSSSAAKLPELVYAEGTTAIDDEDELQKAYDEAHEQSQSGIAIEYQGVVASADGENFTCHIGNPASNGCDMFIAIFADDNGNFGDQLYLSGLAKAGTAFEQIKFEKKLEKGTYPAYLVFTQVDDDHQTILGQSTVTIEVVVE